MEINTGNTAWLLLSSALVLLMTPGLALFYGGLNRSKGVLNMMMMSFSAIGLVSVLWVVYGFTLAFGVNESEGLQNIIGNFDYLGTDVAKISEEWLFFGANTGIPTYAFLVFQMMFAVITVALISGAVSDRMKFGGWVLFALGWFTLVYIPVAHMVWGGGFIGTTIRALDFAGGTAVHINAGAAALALVLVLGKRIGWPKENMRPHNVPFVALGAGLLWFGWFGFNAGSELTVDGTTVIAFINTQVATAAALLGWVAVEWIRDRKPTLVGASSGAVAGLVAITPACGFVAPLPAVLIGLLAGAVCALAVGLKYRFGYDDSLDVVGVHFVGGWIGSLAIGFFATDAVNSGITDEKILNASNGLFYGGGATQLLRQFEASALVTVYSFGVALLLAFILKAVKLLRVSEESEVGGIDIAAHGETGYEFTPAAGSGNGGAFALAGIGQKETVDADGKASVSQKVSG
ncbi:Amt family ammonium transporter [Actinoplanes campanulatus]|uniref:Ammonium transporter n=1 Tax=Actinoplanes campanulatus TaxID=113559 RepID=A0A7W5ABT2_9ACTN|nr:ammonium transporter [Actinoplanes campanulatus]MBB3093135.1 Amt family ammonium transporter [Actinoplanes campanulatus]GGN01398.1 ammonium transporter [Actinoplanes campanulatus]GID33769.1 ammonium transporter [Actinoplanes campanulatus]